MSHTSNIPLWKRAIIIINGCFTMTNPAMSPPVLSASLDGTAPDGYRVLHVAQTGMEADLLRQVLAEEGFEAPYVPSVWTAVAGQIGNNPNVYVRAEQYDEAREFLLDFLTAPLEGMDKNSNP